MASDKMLIDAAHPEETRVVVLRGNRIEEFDYESAAKKLLRGNIYLAKITRVEPSLQAAFVDYGGNRHGFLAFSEIHPDYYQIPVADRQALLREEAEAAEEEAQREANEHDQPSSHESHPEDGDGHEHGPTEIEEAGGGSVPWDVEDVVPTALHQDSLAPAHGATVAAERHDPVIHGSSTVADLMQSHEALTQDAAVHDVVHGQPGDDLSGNLAHAQNGDASRHPVDASDLSQSEQPEHTLAADSPQPEEAAEETPERKRRPRRASYKIQEVIKRRQIILVQVVKEERGNKGAALTTYLSLAGRYTVLMPNTARGGGISRKITNAVDRRRLKEITGELEVPDGMGLIVRTAGASRTTAEIKRDHDYLLRLWESIRDLTLNSTAPALVYEEGSLVKRSIRDLYSKEIEEVVVAGQEAYESARDFMRMLMPSHAKNVKQYSDAEPLFARYQIERQLNAMYSPYVTLKSGGYIVLNQTEALVAIDVNSGKSTREHNIEDTALNTNLEACDEVARQLRLRDLAGLIVIDFIDMDERRNNRSVENRLKNALKHDRARIQVGRISHFGLMEMSRQRLRTGVLEGSTSQCPHCMGTGVIRSTESVALAVLRALEDNLMGHTPRNMVATTSIEVALYLLNEKRAYLRDIEARYGVVIEVDADAQLQGANFRIDATGAATGVPEAPRPRHAVQLESGFEANEPDDESADGTEPGHDAADSAPEAIAESGDDAGEETGENGERKRSRRRRRRRGERGDRPEREFGEQNGQARSSEDNPQEAIVVETLGDSGGMTVSEDEVYDGPDGEDDASATGDRNGAPSTGESDRGERRGRRRGRRGGRRNRRGGREGGEGEAPQFDNGNGHQAQPDVPLTDVMASATSDQPVVHPGAWGSLAGDAREPTVMVQTETVETGWISPKVIEQETPPPAASFVAEPTPPPAEPIVANHGHTAGFEPDTGNQPVEQPMPAITTQDSAPAMAPAVPVESPIPSGPPKRGWWTKRFSAG